MDKLLYVLGVAMMVFGIVIGMSAKSATHEVLSAIFFGSGTLALGLGSIIGWLRKIAQK